MEIVLLYYLFHTLFIRLFKEMYQLLVPQGNKILYTLDLFLKASFNAWV